MSKVLFIGPYLQIDRWGKISRDIITSLRKDKIDFMARPISYTDIDNDISIPEEQEFFEKVDVIIQHCLPKDFYYRADCKCIFFHDVETSGGEFSNVNSIYELADEVWITDKEEAESLNAGSIVSRFVDLSLTFNDIGNAHPNPQIASIFQNNTVFFCNAGLEDGESLHKIKAAFYATFLGDPKHKLLLYSHSIADTQSKIDKNSFTISPVEKESVLLIDESSGLPEDYFIKHSDVVVSTPQFININYTIAKSIFYGTPYIYINEINGYEDLCVIPHGSRGTTDFGSVREYVQKTTIKSLVEEFKYFDNQLNRIAFSRNIIADRDNLISTNIGNLLNDK